jgi:hypothetical protein
VNLLGGDEGLTGHVNNPINVDRIPLVPEDVRDEDNPLTFVIPYATTILFYIIILAAASMMLNSVAIEKQTQVIEVLMLSMTPRQLLTGKIGHHRIVANHHLYRHLVFPLRSQWAHIRNCGQLQLTPIDIGVGYRVLSLRVCYLCQFNGWAGGIGAKCP